jgi:hypothetical protein
MAGILVYSDKTMKNWVILLGIWMFQPSYYSGQAPVRPQVVAEQRPYYNGAYNWNHIWIGGNHMYFFEGW